MSSNIPIGNGPLGPRADLLNLKYNVPTKKEAKEKPHNTKKPRERESN